MYSIKAAASITGLKTETVRAWERRYGAINPQRDDNGRRVYSRQDIERLSLLSNTTQRGHSISKVANLENSQLEAIINDGQQATDTNQDSFYMQIVNALIDYKLDQCEEMLRRALMARSPMELANEVIFPALEKVGQLWETGKISIAQEHMFAALVKRMVMSMVNHSRPFLGAHPCMAFTTLSGENHEFGILLSYLVAVNKNCRSFYLGPDLPCTELIKVQKQIKSDVIVISLVNVPPAEDLVVQLENLAQSVLGTGTELWIGGNGANYLKDNGRLPEPCVLLSNLNDFSSRTAILLNQE